MKKLMHSAFNPQLTIGDPVAIKDVTVSTVTLRAGTETIHQLDGLHSFGLSPAYETVVPAANESSRWKDIYWAPNSVGYLPPGVRLEYAFLEASRATYIVIPDRIFRQAAFETIDTSSVRYRWLPGINDPITTDLVTAMDKVAKAVDLHDFPMIADAIGTALAVRIMQKLGSTPRRADIPHPGGLPPATLQLVVDYVEANLSRQIRLDELAGIAQLSTFHFARAFRTAMNISPVKYVWKQRIERAKSALRTTTDSLVVIAIDCGFASQSHFSTAFKDVTGMTPARFRAHLA